MPGKRCALLIGNNKYAVKNFELNHCHKDVRSMSKALSDIGFTIIELFDQTEDDMNNNIKEFVKELDEDSILFLYFSGHGCHNKSNHGFMLPIDYNNTSVLDIKSCTCVNRTMRLIGNKLTHGSCIGVFDACRTFTNKGPDEQPNKGLVGIKGVNVSGCIIAYSCKEGGESYFGTEHSLYTQCLLRNISKPLDVATVFRLTNHELHTCSDNIINDTKRKQESRYVDALRGGSLIMNDRGTSKDGAVIAHFSFGKRRVCRLKPEGDLVWATDLSDDEREYFYVKGNSKATINTKINKWCIPAKNNTDVIFTGDTYAIIEDTENHLSINSGNIYALADTTNENEYMIWVRGKYNEDPTSNETVRSNPKYVSKCGDYWFVNEKRKVIDSSYVKPLTGYWIKVFAISEHNKTAYGYIHSSCVPSDIMQLVLPDKTVWDNKPL